MGTSKKSKSSEGKSASSNTTTDLEEIKNWATKRGGKPVRVKGTESGNKNDGVLRIDFPGYSGGDSLEEISWEDWYKVFRDKDLSFLYQEETADGKESRFFKLVSKK